MSLEGKVALVTGASRGLGRACAEELARRGAAVGVNYRSRPEEAEAVVAAITDAGGTAAALQADVADYDEATGLVQACIEQFGDLHILVNNAGIARDSLIMSMEPADWRAVMDVNFGGTFNCTRAVAEHFMRQRDGAIVNVSSVMGERGWIGQSNYAASKGAVNAFTRCAAVEFARFGVRVNAVLPGFAVTELVEELVEKSGKNMKAQIPQRRFGEARQVADAVAFLAGPDAGYLTGVTMPVDGGIMAQAGLGKP